MTNRSWMSVVATGVLVVAACVAAPTPAFAQQGGASKAAAEALFGQAQKLFEEGKLAEACKKFDASQKLDPAVGTLLHLGNCYEKQGKTASAWAAFREAKTLAEANKDDRVKIADVRIQALDPQVSKLQVNVAEQAAGMVVRNNGVELPAATWGTPLPQDAGKHVIEASAPGRKTFRREIEVTDGGSTFSLDIPALEQMAGAEPVPTPTPPTPPTPTPGGGDTGAGGGMSPLRIAGLVVGGAGVASLAVGTAFGVLAMGSNNDSKDLCRTDTLCSQEGLDLRNDAKSQANVSTATFVIGGTLLAAGVVLFVVGGEDGEEQAESVGPVRMRLSASVGPAFNGLTLQGAW